MFHKSQEIQEGWTRLQNLFFWSAAPSAIKKWIRTISGSLLKLEGLGRSCSSSRWSLGESLSRVRHRHFSVPVFPLGNSHTGGDSSRMPQSLSLREAPSLTIPCLLSVFQSLLLWAINIWLRGGIFKPSSSCFCSCQVAQVQRSASLPQPFPFQWTSTQRGMPQGKREDERKVGNREVEKVGEDANEQRKEGEWEGVRKRIDLGGWTAPVLH